MQEEVERALAVLLRVGPVQLTVAGRTDAGVHAWGQVASYDGEPVRLESLNALLPDDVSALSCAAAGPEFDARRDATSRAYCYRVQARRARSAVEAGRALHWPHPVDFGALEQCAATLAGTHDFTAFTPTETEHVHFSREVYTACWRRAASAACPVYAASSAYAAPAAFSASSGGLLEFWIEADAFMRHMNRVLVGTMLEVAGGRRTVDDFVSLLEGRPRSDAGPTAPAHGLFLAGVGYGGRRVLGSEGPALRR